MLFKLITLCAVVQLVVSQDAPITYKDGKIGVNFGGYHAEAGLGGLLTGNAAHGGLTASAGTPFGQSAHAGLGGNTGPNARGGLFAGATAGSGVGASASLAGDVNNGGSFGVGQAEAYVPGARKEVIKTVSSGNPAGVYLPAEQAGSGTNVDSSSSAVSSSSASIDADDNDLTDNKMPQTQTVQQQTVTQVVQPANVVNVQKIKVRPRPAQTYTVVQKQVQVPTYTTVIKQYPIPVYQPAVFHKRIQITAPYQVVQQRVEEVQTTAGPTTTTTSTTPRPPYVYTYDKQKVINEIFSIPFHALRAVNEIINAKLAGGYSVQKTITYN
ncbi:uncharacterized protein LOC129576483 isoform X2 [Sitodiplosis mosellana]|uniref:uncharacterized protein LOC129576483 isoform X2 n=1 Tax=Sitodiplosis mosellana TaxID=263140 RepID=UPI0024437B55|nr:uncharacterized protein LOC129576483 isoform X2 [Sitodiplosis mosellana]